MVEIHAYTQNKINNRNIYVLVLSVPKLSIVVNIVISDELVVIELLQYSDYSDGAVRLASFSTSAREFLFPYPSLSPSYSSASREALLSRTIAWPVSLYEFLDFGLLYTILTTVQREACHISLRIYKYQ